MSSQIANARMYSVAPSLAGFWQRLFTAIGDQADVPLTWLEYPPPAPLDELWHRDDMGAVFMCGLPFSRSVPRPYVVAAPVPSPPEYEHQPRYWSEFVVHADSSFELIEDTFGHRIAFTTLDSQSGCLAALYYFMTWARPGALYREVIEPRITPTGAAIAVIEGIAEVAPIDSFALSLLQRYRPELTSQLRVVARTPPTAIPLIVASDPVPDSLESAFLEAHKNASTGALMAALQLERFARPDGESYDLLKRRLDVATAFWRQHPFAVTVHPAFAELASGRLLLQP